MNRPLVCKFGGSTFASAGDYRRIGQYLAKAAQTAPVVAVVSAPPGLTEAFRERLFAVNPASHDETVGGLLPRADTVGAFLLKAALDGIDVPARVLTAPELGITTTGSYVRARVHEVEPAPARRALDEYRIVIVPGGQALDASGRQVWLGKNSSDYSAILLAVALGAKNCTFYSDVEGVFSSDPRIIPAARPLARIGYRAALAASLAGAKVIHHGSVAHAEANSLKIVCRLNKAPFHKGTIIGEEGDEPIVVPDERSRIFVFPDADSLAAAERALKGAYMPVVPTTSFRRHSLAVTCGFSTPETTLRQAALEVRETGEKLLSVISPDGRTQLSLHADTDRLFEAARHAFAAARGRMAPSLEFDHV